MENELVVDERAKWVRRYAIAIEVVGVLVILSSAVYLSLLLLGLIGGPLNQSNHLLFVSHGLGLVNAGVNGVVALALAQLVRYVFGERKQRGLLLRFAPQGLVLWAVLVLVARFVSALAMYQFMHQNEGRGWLAFATPDVIVGIAKALILVSLALVLRKALPIVEESRSLV